MVEHIGAAKCYSFTTIPNINISCYRQWNKLAKQDYIQPSITAHGNNNTDKIIIDGLSPHIIYKLYLAKSLMIV